MLGLTLFIISAISTLVDTCPLNELSLDRKSNPTIICDHGKYIVFSKYLYEVYKERLDCEGHTILVKTPEVYMKCDHGYLSVWGRNVQPSDIAQSSLRSFSDKYKDFFDSWKTGL